MQGSSYCKSKPEFIFRIQNRFQSEWDKVNEIFQEQVLKRQQSMCTISEYENSHFYLQGMFLRTFTAFSQEYLAYDATILLDFRTYWGRLRNI